MTGGPVSIVNQVGTGEIGRLSWYNMSVEDASYPSLPTITDQFIPTLSYSSGWSSADGKQLQHPYGFILLRATSVFSEWTASNQVLLSLDSPIGDNLTVDVNSSGSVGISFNGGSRMSLGTISAGVEVGVAIKWDSIAGTVAVQGWLIDDSSICVAYQFQRGQYT
jgi:hypothetical protein